MENSFNCTVCKQDKNVTTGYGLNKENDKVCYACCGKIDTESLLNLKPKEIHNMYWSKGVVTNWPNTLSIKPYYTKDSRHNWGLIRTDFWFNLEGKSFHGYQIGRNTEIAYIQKIK